MMELEDVDTRLGCVDKDTDNHLLRALDGCSWVAKDAHDMIKNSQQFMMDHRPWLANDGRDY
jgi:hypothetical protein